MTRLGGWTLRKRVLWALVVLVATSALWVLKVEIVYRHNVNRMPALYQFHRHVVTRLWSA